MNKPLDAAIEAASAAYYDAMVGQPPHSLGWAGCAEPFKSKVRDKMAIALFAAVEAYKAHPDTSKPEKWGLCSRPECVESGKCQNRTTTGGDRCIEQAEFGERIHNGTRAQEQQSSGAPHQTAAYWSSIYPDGNFPHGI